MVKNISIEQLKNDEIWYRQRHHQIRKKQGWTDQAIKQEWENLKNRDISIEELEL